MNKKKRPERFQLPASWGCNALDLIQLPGAPIASGPPPLPNPLIANHCSIADRQGGFCVPSFPPPPRLFSFPLRPLEPMASGLSTNRPPSPSLFVQPPPEDEAEDVIDIDIDIDGDGDRPLSRASTASTTTTTNWNDIDELLGTRDRAFLSPDTAAFPQRPSSRMSDSHTTITEGATAASAPAASPFNFQTQFMSTSPVKPVSVRLLYS